MTLNTTGKVSSSNCGGISPLKLSWERSKLSNSAKSLTISLEWNLLTDCETSLVNEFLVAIQVQVVFYLLGCYKIIFRGHLIIHSLYNLCLSLKHNLKASCVLFCFFFYFWKTKEFLENFIFKKLFKCINYKKNKLKN